MLLLASGRVITYKQGGVLISIRSSESKNPFSYRVFIQAILSLLLVGLVTSCASSNSGNLGEESSGEQEASTESFESKGCLEVSTYLTEAIGTGIMDGQITGRAAGFIASEFADVKFVAVEIAINGVSEPRQAVFATNDDILNDDQLNGVIFAADAFAQEFSDWGSPEKLGLSIASTGAKESVECLALLD